MVRWICAWLLVTTFAASVATAATIDKMNRSKTKFVINLSEEEKALVADKKVVFVLFKDTRQSEKAKIISIEDLQLTVELEKSLERFDEYGFVKITLKPIKKNFVKVVVLQANEWGDRIVMGVPYWMIEGMEIGADLIVEYGRSEVSGTIEEINANRVTLKLREQALDLKKGRTVAFVPPEGPFFSLLPKALAGIYLPRGPRVDVGYSVVNGNGDVRYGETSNGQIEKDASFLASGILHLGEQKDLHLQVEATSLTFSEIESNTVTSTDVAPASEALILNGFDASLFSFSASVVKSFANSHHLGVRLTYSSSSVTNQFGNLETVNETEFVTVQDSLDSESTATQFAIGYAVSWASGHFAIDMIPSTSVETVVESVASSSKTSNELQLALWQSLGKNFHLYADTSYSDTANLEGDAEKPNISRQLTSHLGWHYWLTNVHNVSFGFDHRPASYADLPELQFALGYGYRDSRFEGLLQALYTQTAGSLGEDADFNHSGMGIAAGIAVKIDDRLLTE